jgi:hypothetical protein
MGRTNVILDIKVLTYNDCIILSQTHYGEKMLKRFEHFDYPPMPTPYDLKIHLVKNHSDGVLQGKYAKIISSFMFWQTVYAMILYMLLAY